MKSLGQIAQGAYWAVLSRDGGPLTPAGWESIAEAVRVEANRRRAYEAGIVALINPCVPEPIEYRRYQERRDPVYA